ncbi:MAG: methyltransferase domain-containing protein [Candidatus Fermentibacter sp.]|nr:methyltransferase domain-containing protein [Candidatus Fermentibacter sp.]
MNLPALEMLCCPACHATFDLERRSSSGIILRSADLTCTGCRCDFRIFHGRPLLVRHDGIHEWKAPIDEVLGIPDLTPVEGPLSMGRLARMGVDSAIDLLKSPGRLTGCIPGSKPGSAAIPEGLDGQVVYRMSGRWLGSRGRKEKLEASITAMRRSVRAFVDAAISADADTILDIASGGGSGICCIASVLTGDQRIFAAERDYKCLWAIQSKFEYLGRASCCEAVGADILQLPFRDRSIDLITSLAALPEIMGISRVLSEISRILTPGGRYVALYNPDPDTYGILPVVDYSRFAREADLYSGHDDFLRTAAGSGLVPVEVDEFDEDSRRRVLTIFRKP